MASFKYEAVDRGGDLKSGVLNADSARQARFRLRELGLLPVDVTELRPDSPSALYPVLWRRGVSSAQLSLMTRQFSGLLSGGVTVENALTALIDQTESRALRHALAGVRGEVMEGSSLAEAMRKFPSVFPEIYHTLIEAGESSGELDTVLMKLADYTERSQALKDKVTLAFVYPAIVTAVAALVTLGLLVYVAPQVVAVFERTHQKLPFLTRALMGVSDFLLSYGLYVMAGALVAALALWKLMQVESFRYKAHAAALRAPVFGKLIRAINAGRLSSALAILISGGVPLLAAIRAGMGMIGSLPMRNALASVFKEVREGGSLSRSLARTKMYPPVMTSFIANGESGGNLGEMLERAAFQQFEEIKYRITAMTNLLEPALILGMGVVVLTIALAILMPIFEMNQLIR